MRLLWSVGKVLVLFGCLLATGSPTSMAQAPAAKEDPWRPIRFMEGEWTGESEGQAGKGTVKRSYRFVLGDRFLHEKNVSTRRSRATRRARFTSTGRSSAAIAHGRRSFYDNSTRRDSSTNTSCSPSRAPAPSCSRARPSRTFRPGGRRGRRTRSCPWTSSWRPSSSHPVRAARMRCTAGTSSSAYVYLSGANRVHGS